jgi:hypothetical protein
MRRAIDLLAMAVMLMTAPAIGAEMQYPDVQAQWRNPTAGRGGNPWDPGKPMGLAQQAPLTPEYQARFEASVKAQKSGGQGTSPGSTCLPAGMPKMMNFAEPMEIVIRPAITYLIPMQVATRRIHTDGRTWPTDEPPTLAGTSIGRWIDEDGDGRYDVLEVETRNFKGPRVFESTGLPLHDDNQTIVKERIYLDKTNPGILYDEETVLDHALTRPWTVRRTYRQVREPVWLETICDEADPQIRIGDEDYFLTSDRVLMPTRKDQPPPDLRNFK